LSVQTLLFEHLAKEVMKIPTKKVTVNFVVRYPERTFSPKEVKNVETKKKICCSFEECGDYHHKLSIN